MVTTAMIFATVVSAGCGGDWIGDTGSGGDGWMPDSGLDLPAGDALPADVEAVGDDFAYDSSNDSVIDAALQDAVQADNGGTPGEFVVSGIEPSAGASGAPTTVTIRGAGLDDAVQVWFGQARSPSIFPISSGLLNCVAPPGAAGPVQVVVVDRFGRRAVSPVDFVYESPLSIRAVDPASGPSSGGTPVSIGGSGFGSSPRVFIGGRPAISVSVVDDSTMLAVTPPGAAGTADVRVVSDEGESILDAGWTYVADPVPPTLPGIIVESVSPSSGPAAGGTTIRISGSGFFDGMGVRVGALPCPVVRTVSDNLIEAVTPPGTPGAADVVLFYRYGQVMVRDGFFYQGDDGATMGIFEMDPPDAAWGGGSLVTIRGFGLSTVDKVWFGEYPGEVVDVVSDFAVTVRTPRAEKAGSVFVMAAGHGAAMAMDAFRFYDPYIYGGGVRGRPIENNLNVTLYNPSTLARIPGATVIVGSDPHTPLQGRTDDRGQITFARPGLAGPLAVSATLETWTAMTVSGFGAQDVTMGLYSAPAPENPTEGQPSEPTKPCTVQGRVADFGKYFLKPPWLDGTAWVECFSSTSSMYSSMGSIPLSNRPDADGRFNFTGRGGEFAVICRLMVQETGAAEGYPIRMGIRRHVKCRDGVSPETVVSLAIPTESALRFGIFDMPEYPLGVTEPRFTGGWHLGTDGYLPLPWRGSFDGGVATFPHQPSDFSGDGDDDLAGDGFDLYVTVSSREPAGFPYSVVQMTGVDPASAGAVFTGVPDALSLTPISITGSFRSFTRLADGTVMAVDDAGRTWVYGADGFAAGRVTLGVRINDFAGLSPLDFTAVGSAGRIMDVSGGVSTVVQTPFVADFLAIDQDSAGGQSIVTATYLLNRENGVITVEGVPAGARMGAVRRFDDGAVFAVGPDGMIVTGTAGGEFSAVTAVAEDLYAVEGESSARVWAAGENGRVISIRDGDVTVFKTPGTESLRGILVLGECDVLFYGDQGALYRFDCFRFTDLSAAIPPRYTLAGGAVLDPGAGTIALISAPVVELTSFAGFPTLSYPTDGSEWDHSGFTWQSGESWGATHCQGLVSGAAGNVFWQFLTDGGEGGVSFPDFARIMGYDPVPPGPKRLNVTCSRTPRFDIDNHDYRSLNTSTRETYSVDVGAFF